MSKKRFYKSKTDVKICGVCGGIAEFLGIDSTIVRLIWVIASLGSFGTGILIYLIFAIAMTDNPNDTYVVKDDGRRDNVGNVGDVEFSDADEDKE